MKNKEILINERVPADYKDMSISEAQHFDRKVRQNFIPAIISTAKQIIEDYGVLEGIGVEVGCGTALFAIELCRRSHLTIYALEQVKAIYEVAHVNIEKEGLMNRIIPVLGNAHNLPFESEFADFIVSRGSYHCWKDKARVFKEIYRVLKKGGIGFVGGGFGRYVSEEEAARLKSLRDRSLGEDAGIYNSPDKLKKYIREADISDFLVIYDKADLWAQIRK